MLQKVEPISITDFNKGLYTDLNILNNEKGQSPNCMNVKWNADGSIQKRYGSTTRNTLQLGSTATAGWTLDSGTSLIAELKSFWKMNETSAERYNEIGTNNLSQAFNSTPSQTGIRGNAVDFIFGESNGLYANNNLAFSVTNGNISVSNWVYLNTTGITQDLISKWDDGPNDFEYRIQIQTDNTVRFLATNSSGVGAGFQSVTASSFGALATTAWYNIVCWHQSGAAGHIGISVNLSVNTLPYTDGVRTGTAQLILGIRGNTSNYINPFFGRMDEVGIWGKVLTSTDRSNLYGGGSGNTYTGSGQSNFSWAMYDFGASSIRWLTVAAGTGIYASSDMGVNFINVATTRTQNYQYFERSKNVLIATSDSYDVPMYWAGSVGTFFATLAPSSAPSVKFSINHQGFLILLNSSTRKRGFYYQDDNTQLTSAWPNNFDLPSSADDEITAPFTIGKTLYVSTKYRIFRVSYVGGNPDWSYQQVRDWGFVSRTVKKISLKGGEVVVGMDWSRRLRVFDGVDDEIISTSIEKDNSMCDFSTEKISYAGSGLIISHAEVDPLEHEYRLNVAVGSNSSQTTHAIVLNGRSLAFYPYSNQGFQCMCVAESAGRQFLIAADRSGRVHILNTGLMDVSTAIDDIYDSPFMFKVSPSVAQKSQRIDLYFRKDSAGRIIYQDRADLSSVFSNTKTFNILDSESVVAVIKSIDLPASQNIFQFKLTSSMGTAEPWTLNHVDYMQSALGFGVPNV